MWRESGLFDAREHAALGLAEAMSSTPADASDELFDEARRHFNEAELVKLASAIAMENYRARFDRAFGIESEHSYSGELPTTT